MGETHPPTPSTPPPQPPPGPGPGRVLIDLWPHSERGGRYHAQGFEAAIELIEATNGTPFTLPDIHKTLCDARTPGYGWPAADAAIRALAVLDLITPIGKRSNTTVYAITPGCEPRLP